MDLMNVLITNQYLRRIGGNSSGGGADWNANEGEAGYIKNRTHYTEENKIEIFSGTVTASEYRIPLSVPEITEGFNEVIVVYDGVENRFAIYEPENSTLTAAGNLELVGVQGSYDVPYCIVFPTPSLFFIDHKDFILGVEDVTHTFTIYCVKPSVHKIDAKYLPNGIGYEEVKEVCTPIFENVNGRRSFSMGTYVYTYDTTVTPFVVGDKYRLVIDDVEFEGVATEDGWIPGVLTTYSKGYQHTTSYDVTPNNPCVMSLYHYETQSEVHKIDPKYLPDVADLDAQWLADLKVALNK